MLLLNPNQIKAASGIISKVLFGAALARILVVEDDELLGQSLLAWLETELHKVDLIADGLQASEYLNTFDYDLLVLDWQLPGQTGIEICRQYRQKGGSAYILMLTGQSSFEQKEEGLDTGADDYMTKPFDKRELFARIRALLRRPKSISNDKFVVGELTLDTGSHLFTFQNTPLKLMPLEYSLLEFLWRNQGQVFSCEDLLRKLWSADEEVSLGSVYSCMNRLRNKLKAKGISELIQTVHGVGYKLVLPEQGNPS